MRPISHMSKFFGWITPLYSPTLNASEYSFQEFTATPQHALTASLEHNTKGEVWYEALAVWIERNEQMSGKKKACVREARQSVDWHRGWKMVS